MFVVYNSLRYFNNSLVSRLHITGNSDASIIVNAVLNVSDYMCWFMEMFR